ncbi:MAG: DEDD exonuclease domain-containing protein [Acidimicrobiaceae bacterium]|nr:DEDD exonuclease domain-containing protein [Acidimicrobiaceae bacterium]MYG54941.1 DEDD exonuclease domain-containing protein [Acidimicrobiaceae bacterium]MYJ98565.1 DEDD exonuclease domain-containing protein [Acidimicrobiaceae bacterium]
MGAVLDIKHVFVQCFRVLEQTFAYQQSFEDLGTPLYEVTFVVIDLETTGASAANCAITEIGAVKLRGGECLGTYQTLVDPGCAIPPEITVLTGITGAMVMRAPRIEAVMPSLLEFIDGAVIVGHNIRFDISFLNAALTQLGRPRLAARSIDTLALARRLLRDEVPNYRLGTLADRLRLSHKPSHRALDDALATGDLLHFLLERAATLGVLGLEDLIALPKLAGSPQAKKLNLTDGLPREPGVYMFRDARDEVLYVGKAANLRSRVRSYFSTDERRKVGQLLRETHRIDHQVCRNGLEAAVLELRLIHQYLPRFNRQGTRAGKYPYIKLTLNERFPRLSVVRKVNNDKALYLGPVASTRVAKRIIEAIHSVAPVRRCGIASRASPNASICASAQLGVSCCPCSGATSEAEYTAVVEELVTNLTSRPDLLLAPLAARIERLATDHRYEEAADVRDRAEALAGLLRRHRRFDLLRRAGRLRLRIGNGWVELVGGRLSRSGHAGDSDELFAPVHPCTPEAPPTEPLPVPQRAEADELLTVVSWIERNADKVTIEEVEGVLANPLPALPVFKPKTKSPARRTATRTGVVPLRRSASAPRPRISRIA